MIGSRSFVLALLLGACATEPEPLSTGTQAMEGRVFEPELALDAPWRIEPEEVISLCPDPKAGCAPSYRYEKVPIVVSLRDGGVDVTVQSIKSVEVIEIGTGYSRKFELAQFHEVEWTHARWPWPLPSENFELDPAGHHLCRIWQGDPCPGAFGVTTSVSEWDGLLFYAIQQPKHRGQDVRLLLRLNYIKGEYERQGNASVLVTHPDVFENEVVVHLGDAPMPKFGTDWSYGDLHYHSQGTDNEGESGYGHRATLHAASAIGLDFILATEHASDSGQISEFPSSTNLFNTLRDMSGGRFLTLRRRINASDGANAQISSFPRRRNFDHLSLPQIFLGGEVDVYPEVTPEERTAGSLSYGSTGQYQLNTCDVVDLGGPCDLDRLLTPTCSNGDSPSWSYPWCPSGSTLRYIVSDKQGFDLDNYDIGIAHSRQHLVYFPADGKREDAFIASHTDTFGGATRSFARLLRTELTEQGKGAVFLAHPVNSEVEPDGSIATGTNRLGPDIVPYSEAQLGDAFANQHMLGLEAWNEDLRLRTPKESNGFPSWAGGLTPFVAGTTHWGIEDERPLLFSMIHHGVAAWDRMLRWGIDPTRTAGLSWLAPGHARRVFFAAGSDAHGDLNYRRAGYMFGVSEVNDTAIGKPRNLVFTGAGTAPLGQGQVLSSLRAGQFVATDGPIVRVAIDNNRNGVIDAADTPMGGEGGYIGGADVPIVVEWISTPEFGPVTRIELAVGAHSDKLARGMTFAPREHGVRTERDPAGTPQWVYHEPSTGLLHTFLSDGYWLDPTGALRFAPAWSERYAGRRSILLHPADYRIGITRITSQFGAEFLDPTIPDRMYVRAFVATDIAKETQTQTVCQQPQSCQLHNVGCEDDPDEATDCVTVVTTTCSHLMGCVPRMAFSNPVWADAKRPAVVLPPEGPSPPVK